jgi:hypothetical protein
MKNRKNIQDERERERELERVCVCDKMNQRRQNMRMYKNYYVIDKSKTTLKELQHRTVKSLSKPKRYERRKGRRRGGGGEGVGDQEQIERKSL